MFFPLLLHSNSQQLLWEHIVEVLSWEKKAKDLSSGVEDYPECWEPRGPPSTIHTRFHTFHTLFNSHTHSIGHDFIGDYFVGFRVIHLFMWCGGKWKMGWNVIQHLHISSASAVWEVCVSEIWANWSLKSKWKVRSRNSLLPFTSRGKNEIKCIEMKFVFILIMHIHIQ